MLSNCQDCKYYHSELCAVNPTYWTMAQRLQTRLLQEELGFFAADLRACPNWELSEEQQLLSLELTFSKQEWRQFLGSLSPGNAPSRQLADQVRAALGMPEEICPIPVASSNVAAIGYREADRVLLVDFLSGSRYHYYEVPPREFEAFLAAPSKGRYLNRYIKGEYEYKRLS